MDTALAPALPATPAELTQARSRVTAALEQVLRDGSVPLAAQPILGPGTGPGRQWMEVLARPRVDGVSVSPEDLATYAERTGHGLAFDAAVLSSAARWLARTPAVRWCSVNLTGATLCSDAPVVEVLLQAMHTHAADPRRLVVEISELSPLHDLARAREVLLGLKRAGARVAIDDFGAGFSHLRLGYGEVIDCIKADAALVWESVHAPGGPDLRVLRGLHALATALSADLVLEGMESDHERAATAALRGVYRQGYALGRPRAIEEVVRCV